MTTEFDCIVLGGGVESLVAAGYLGKAGRSVLLVEERDHLGGAFVTSDPVPGFRFETCEHSVGYLAPAVVDDLALAHHGLQVAPGTPLLVAPRLDGPPIRLSGDVAATAEALRPTASADADQWPGFVAVMTKLAGLLTDIYTRPAPRPGHAGVADLMTLATLGRKARALGKKDMIEFLRVFPMPVADVLDDWFTDDVLKGALATIAIRHLAQGPKSAGTAFTFLHDHVGGGGVPRARPVVAGGVGHLPWALEVSARSRGVDIRTGVAIEEVVVQDGGVTGVRLAGGETVNATTVVSGLDPRRTYFGLIDQDHLEPEFLETVERVRYRGVAAKVNLALSRLPRFTGLDDADLEGTVVLTGGVQRLEEAYNSTKYGAASTEPVLEIVVPSLADPSLAPEGQHVLSAWVHYAPYHLRDGSWDDTARARLGDTALDVLSRYAPDIGGDVVGREVLTPADIESRFGHPEGQLADGERTLDQILFMRPVPGWSHYDAPLKGLYLCGPATHPAGGITGQSGALAARTVLAGS